MGQYHAALKREILDFARGFEVKPKIETIFLGGGTPSTYPNDLLLDLSETLHNLFDLETNLGIHRVQQTHLVGVPWEFTIEVNPGTVKPGQIEVWKQAGINRLSIGVQSLNDKVLHNLNRLQTVKDVTTLIDLAHKQIENLSIDMIIGLPGIDQAQWKEMVQTVTSWPIKHMSVYFLTIHEGTALFYRLNASEQAQRDAVRLPEEDGVVDLYLWTVDFLASKGFEQYEISNFAKPGYRSQHNQAYWRYNGYKGFGVGACSFEQPNIRMQNEKNIFNYIEKVEKGENPVSWTEQLTDDQLKLERMMLGLRQTHGIAWADLPLARTSPVVHELIASGFIQENEERLKLTPAGLAVENDIVLKLINHKEHICQQST